jgi:hypothetical protein
MEVSVKFASYNLSWRHRGIDEYSFFNLSARWGGPLYPLQWLGTSCASSMTGLQRYGKSRLHRDSIPGPSRPYRAARRDSDRFWILRETRGLMWVWIFKPSTSSTVWEISVVCEPYYRLQPADKSSLNTYFKSVWLLNRTVARQMPLDSAIIHLKV